MDLGRSGDPAIVIVSSTPKGGKGRGKGKGKRVGLVESNPAYIASRPQHVVNHTQNNALLAQTHLYHQNRMAAADLSIVNLNTEAEGPRVRLGVDNCPVFDLDAVRRAGEHVHAAGVWSLPKSHSQRERGIDGVNSSNVMRLNDQHLDEAAGAAGRELPLPFAIPFSFYDVEIDADDMEKIEKT